MKIICLICHENFTEKSEVLSTLCGHLFHTNCFFKSNITTNTNECPKCRDYCRSVHKVFLLSESENKENYQPKHSKNSNTEPVNLQQHQFIVHKSCGELFLWDRILDLKSVYLQYDTLVHWDTRTTDSSTKHLMFQALFFFSLLLIDLGHPRLFIFIMK